MSYSNKKNSDFSSALKSFLLCFYIKNDTSKVVKDSSISSGSSGPEATMISAAKHFSSAHKVRLI
ncbi:hypothetical protein RND71_002857 [Anisodus tanguticus]|uniref:Uncharacterized protein n=1 Tax=Anisodus tanguticus TaxID=243964 RepID=A0AAE1SVL4_9SOLA|nr:hypothetical protein RND71_002857 [Anisodus tanguticus]